MSAVAQKREEFATKASEFDAIMTEGKTEDPAVIDIAKITRLKGTKDEKLTELKRRKVELEALGQQVDLLNMADENERLKARIENPVESPFTMTGATPQKSAADLYIKSANYKARTANTEPADLKDIDAKDWLNAQVKTTMTTAAGWAVPTVRRDDLMTRIATRPVQVLDVIPQSDTDQGVIAYMEETTFTNNAAEASENAAYGESASAWTERTNTVRKIGHFIPVTDEQLDDVPQVRTFLDEMLPFAVRQRLDLQVIAGNGTPPNLMGLLNLSGTSTQAKGGDSVPAAIFKAMVKVRVTGRAIPSAVLIHPTDWQNIRLLTTADGIFLWGSPAEVGADRIWGLTVAQTDAGSAGTAYVADFVNYTRLFFRRGIDVQIGYINDDFKLGKKSLRADVRVAFVVRRPSAVCLVTGL